MRHIFIILFGFGFVHGQINPHTLLHVHSHSGSDTVVSVSSIRWWYIQRDTSQFPLVLSVIPYVIKPSPIHTLGLFLGDSSSISEGVTLFQVFVKTNNYGRFSYDYAQTSPAYFINHSLSANTQIVTSPQGLFLVAKEIIVSGAEVTSNYNDFLALFPGDDSVRVLVDIIEK